VKKKGKKKTSPLLKKGRSSEGGRISKGKGVSEGRGGGERKKLDVKDQESAVTEREMLFFFIL